MWRGAGWAGRDGGPAFLAAAGLGYVMMAYAVLAVGVLGWLRPEVLVAIVVGGLVLGLRSVPAVTGALRRVVTRAVVALRGSRYRILYGAVAVWLALTFLAACGPSDARDWDGISEHLAQAKTYLRHRRVMPLWYDHHSQFPATTVMLYCIGLALGGQGAAKLFHWGFAVMSMLAVWQLARRHLRVEAGGPAAWVLATTPVFGWLATVGYVDLGSVLFSVLAVDYLLAWRASGERADLMRAGLMVGAGMTVKMQGLFTFAVLLAAAVVWCARLRRRLRPAVAFAALAAAVAAPWYVKSWLVTGNPVYPFAYGLFGGKHWSAEQARHYAYHHASFGYGRLPPEPTWQRMSLLEKRTAGARNPAMVLLAPFTLTFLPEYYAPRQPRVTAMLLLSIGPMYLALVPTVLAFRRRKPRAVVWLVGLFVVFWLVWFETTQLVRYLLPWLVLLAPVAGLALAWWMAKEGAVGGGFRAMGAVWSVVALAFIVWQVGPLLPVVGGLEDAGAFLMRSLDCYRPIAFVNSYTPPDALIGTYGEPRLFYMDRDYIWADPGHSQLIAYAEVATPEELVGEYWRLGIEYLLVNQQFFGPIERGEDKLHTLLAEALERDLLAVVETFEGGKFLVLRVMPE